ncbi:MAG: PAS domain S-box protein [Magnetococcales bacterium]|nr:PAS domain S-box protein [Magnetococcales bacterium]
MDPFNDKRLWRIQQPIIASFLLTFGALVTFFLFSVHWMHTEQEQNLSDHFQKQIHDTLQRLIDEGHHAMAGQLLGLARDPTLVERFLAKDRAALLEAVAPLFTQWETNQKISHLYFHDPEGVNLLRIHRPEVHGDRIGRETLRKARETRQTSHGLEIGRHGGLTLRVVVPWLLQNEIIGYLEMGKEMPALLDPLHAIFNVDLHLLIDKSYLDEASWKARTPHDPKTEWDRFPDLVHAGGTHPLLPEELIQHIRVNQLKTGYFQNKTQEYATAEHIHYFIIPVNDIASRPVARLVVLFEDLPLEKITLGHKKRVILGICASALFLGWMFHRLLLRVEGNLRLATAELRHGEQRNRAILDTALDAIISIDTKGNILEFNKAAEHIFGFRKSEVMGKDISEIIIPPEMREAHRLGLIRYLATGEKKVINQHIELDAINAQGKRIPTEIAITVIPGANFTFFTAFLRDISERKQILSSLNEAIDAAESSNLKLRQEVLRHQQTLARLQASEERFRSVTLSIRDAIIATDQEQNIIFWNKGAEVLFGYSREEILGKKLTPLIPQRHAEGHRKGFQRFLEQGASPLLGQTTEMSGLRQDGSEFPLEMSLNSWTHADGTRFFSAVIRDITERKQTEAMLLTAKESAEAANQAKSLFLANMSHEIRTPMNTIIGMGYLLSQTPLTPGQHSRMRKIQSAAETLLGIINDILDFSKIEAGRLELEHLPFQLGEVMEKVAGMVAMRAEEKGLEILFDLGADLPRSLIGDPLRLEQILINLGTNAVKFTHAGEILFRVEAMAISGQTVRMRFSVRDSGIGLTEAQIAGLFQPFVQADSSTTRHYGGTGLGLAICKSLVDQMNGTFTVISEPGSGSEFAFTIPLERVPPSERLAPPRRIAAPVPLRILVVDDNATARHLLKEMAQGLKCAVEVAESGHEALQKMERLAQDNDKPYDVILLDWQMPEMNGIETARRIRENVAMASSRVIMVTAFGRQEVMKEARTVGVNGFMLKPVTPSMLLNTIQEALGKGIPAEAVDAPVEPQSPPRSPPPVQSRTKALLTRLQGARILVVEDHDINWQVAEEMLSKAGVVAEHASNGQEALTRLTAQPDHFDAVLMDLQMPIMDGYEATRRLRSHFDAKRLPIIAMTANALKSEKDRCLALGMNDYLTKPVHVQQMYAVLAAHLRPTPLETSDTSPPEPTSALPLDTPFSDFPDLAGIDTREALERFGGDQALLKRLARQFVTRHRDSVSRVEERLDAEDPEGARALLHGIKGVSGNLSAHEIFTQASRLETLAKAGDVNGCREGLEALRTGMERLIRAIETLEKADTPPTFQEMAIPRPDPEPFPLEAVKQVRRLLEDGDFRARGAYAAIRERLEPWADPETLARIDQHLELLRFDEAAHALTHNIPAPLTDG